jgi:hypothetical protein
VNLPNQIVVAVPADAATGSITVTDPYGGQTVTSTAIFTAN